MSKRSTRRAFLAASAAAAGVACAPFAPPPAEAPETLDWVEDWGRLVTAAKQEGKLSVLTVPGADVRTGFDAFEKAFPGIAVEIQSHTSPSMAVPRIAQERDAGIYTLDVALFNIQSLLSSLKPAGAFEPLRPAIFRPDVLSGGNWRDGFEAGFMDEDTQWVYNCLADVHNPVWINTDLVRESEIRSIRDLADPRWKAKLNFADVRSPSMSVWMAAVRDRYPDGGELLTKILVDQQPAYSRDVRHITERMTRGTFAFATGITRPVLQEFQDKGQGKNIKELVLPDVQTISTSAGGLWLFADAPNPDAARLFVNWALTREGQQVLSKATKENSRRLDVEPVDRTRLPDPKQAYFVAMQEGNIRKQMEARKFAQRLVG